MLDTPASSTPDRRPAILVCAYDPADSLASRLSDTLDGAMPPGTRVRPVAATDPTVLAGLISGELDDALCRAVLLVGRTRRSDAFRVQMRAENRALGGGDKLSSTGPALARATAPVAEMVRALADAGLPAEASSESEDDAGSYLLYRVLTALPDGEDSPAVGLLRAPSRADTAALTLGVEAAAIAMARHLTPSLRALR